MGRGRKGLRAVAACAVLLLILATVLSYFLPPELPDEFKDGLPEGYTASSSARDAWLSVDAEGVARVHPERCVYKRELVIPEVINGIKVTGFYCDTENSAPWIEKITFAATIETVGEFPLHKWSGLREIVFKEGTRDLSKTYLGTKKNLKKLVIPKSVTSMRADFLLDGAQDMVVHFGGSEAEWQALGRGAARLSEKYTVVLHGLRRFTRPHSELAAQIKRKVKKQ